MVLATRLYAQLGFGAQKIASAISHSPVERSETTRHRGWTLLLQFNMMKLLFWHVILPAQNDPDIMTNGLEATRHLKL